MLHKALSFIDKLLGFDEVNARCEVPGKDYDPGVALRAALSVVHMMDALIETSQKRGEDPLQTQNTISRCIALKELEASRVKDEIRMMWGYFSNSSQIKQYPNAPELVRQVMIKANICQQTVDLKAGQDLLALVNQCAEVFWAMQEAERGRETAPYPSSIAVA